MPNHYVLKIGSDAQELAAQAGQLVFSGTDATLSHVVAGPSGFIEPDLAYVDFEGLSLGAFPADPPYECPLGSSWNTPFEYQGEVRVVNDPDNTNAGKILQINFSAGPGGSVDRSILHQRTITFGDRIVIGAALRMGAVTTAPGSIQKLIYFQDFGNSSGVTGFIVPVLRTNDLSIEAGSSGSGGNKNTTTNGLYTFVAGQDYWLEFDITMNSTPNSDDGIIGAYIWEWNGSSWGSEQMIQDPETNNEYCFLQTSSDRLRAILVGDQHQPDASEPGTVNDARRWKCVVLGTARMGPQPFNHS